MRSHTSSSHTKTHTTQYLNRLVTVNTIKVPAGVDWAAVCKYAMDTYAVEIAGGLGPSVGKVWRVGVMGFNARPMAVQQVLLALRHGLAQQGWKKAADTHSEL